MKKMTLKVHGRTYEKAEPTVKDWLVFQKNQLLTEQGNITAKEAVIRTVADFFMIDRDVIKKAIIPAKRIVNCYQRILENMTACFHPDDDRVSQKYDLIISEQIVEGILAEAKLMAHTFGVTPETYFRQSLQDYLLANTIFAGADGIGEPHINQIDETTF